MASGTKGERPARYSCSTVMKAAGISRNALFNYERHGAVSPQRDGNGYRMYSQGDLLDVMCLTMLVSMGYTVREASDLLKGDDLMGVGNIDAYMARLTTQRDVIQAKLDNLAELRRITVEALSQAEAPLDLVESPDWLFFFDEHESGNLAEAKHDNQVELMRSLPLSCRGFVLQGLFEGAGDGGQGLRYRWARTLRRSHKDLLPVDVTSACSGARASGLPYVRPTLTWIRAGCCVTGCARSWTSAAFIVSVTHSCRCCSAIADRARCSSCSCRLRRHEPGLRRWG